MPPISRQGAPEPAQPRPNRPDPNRPQPTPTFRRLVRVLRLVPVALTRRTWRGTENFPPGGFIAVANHITEADPFTVVHFLVDNGIFPAILGKDSLFKIPVFGRIMHACGFIPVSRDSSAAASSLDAALSALEQGQCVMLYPEGTLTFDPSMWPMTAKTGAARLALASGAPVVPVAHWGAQEFWNPHTRKLRLRRFESQVVACPPVDLASLGRDPDDRDAVAEANRRIMADLTAGVASLRHEVPPAEPFDRGQGKAWPGR